jgi:hypothetical protein
VWLLPINATFAHVGQQISAQCVFVMPFFSQYAIQ